MDKEQLFKSIVIVFFLALAAGYLFSVPFVINNLFVFSIIAVAVFLASIMFEAYVRVQHNIDASLKNINDKIISLRNQIDAGNNANRNEININRNEIIKVNQKISEDTGATDKEIAKMSQSVSDSVRQFFIMKNDINFKLIVFKSNTEKEIKNIKESFEAIKQFQEDLKGRLETLQAPQAKTLKAFWYRSNNLGDRLTPVIVEYFLGKKIELASASDCGKLLGVGSILNELREGDIVWGSGLIREVKLRCPNSVKFLAVRGPLTRSMIEGDVPEVYGDPAILMPLIYNPEIKKTHKVGIVPHYIDKILWENRRLPEGVKFIDVEGNWRKVIDEIVSCEMIRTSSLHGIIIAEAYGVPVVWEKYSDDIVGGEFKFQDYFLGTGRGRQSYGEQLPPLFDLKSKQDILINALEKHYKPKYD
jgi:pyruvyltransferase